MDRRPGRSPSLLGLEGSFALIRFLMVGLKLLTIDLPLSWMFERASKAVTYQEAFSSEELDRKLFLRLGQNYDEPKAWSDANPWLLGLDRLSLETLTWPWSQIWNSQDAWKWKSTWDEIVSKKLEEEDSRSSSFSSSSSDHLENESPVPRDAKRISFIENKEPQMVPFKTIPIPNAEEPQKDNHSNPQLKPPRHENISQMFKEMEQRAALRQQTRSLFDPLEAHVPPKTKSISELKPTTQEHKPLAKLKPALNLEHSRELEPAPELEPGLDLEPAPELKPSPVLEPTPELKLTSNYKPNPKSKRIVSPSRAKSPKVAELCSKFESTNANGTEAKLFKVKEMPQGAVVRKAKVVTKPSANGAISQSDNSLEKHDDDTASGIMPNSSTVIPKIVIRSYEERCATLPPPPKPVTMRHDPVSKPSPNPGPLPKPTLEKAIPRRPNPRPRMEFHYQPPIAVTKDSKAHLHHSSTPILTSIQTLEDQPEGANWNSTWELGSNSTLREASHQSCCQIPEEKVNPIHPVGHSPRNSDFTSEIAKFRKEPRKPEWRPNGNGSTEHNLKPSQFKTGAFNGLRASKRPHMSVPGFRGPTGVRQQSKKTNPIHDPMNVDMEHLSMMKARAFFEDKLKMNENNDQEREEPFKAIKIACEMARNEDLGVDSEKSVMEHHSFCEKEQNEMMDSTQENQDPKKFQSGETEETSKIKEYNFENVSLNRSLKNVFKSPVLIQDEHVGKKNESKLLDEVGPVEISMPDDIDANESQCLVPKENHDFLPIATGTTDLNRKFLPVSGLEDPKQIVISKSNMQVERNERSHFDSMTLKFKTEINVELTRCHFEKLAIDLDGSVGNKTDGNDVPIILSVQEKSEDGAKKLLEILDEKEISELENRPNGMIDGNDGNQITTIPVNGSSLNNDMEESSTNEVIDSKAKLSPENSQVTTEEHDSKELRHQEGVIRSDETEKEAKREPGPDSESGITNLHHSIANQPQIIIDMDDDDSVTDEVRMCKNSNQDHPHSKATSNQANQDEIVGLDPSATILQPEEDSVEIAPCSKTGTGSMNKAYIVSQENDPECFQNLDLSDRLETELGQVEKTHNDKDLESVVDTGTESTIKLDSQIGAKPDQPNIKISPEDAEKNGFQPESSIVPEEPRKEVTDPQEEEVLIEEPVQEVPCGTKQDEDNGEECVVTHNDTCVDEENKMDFESHKEENDNLTTDLSPVVSQIESKPELIEDKNGFLTEHVDQDNPASFHENTQTEMTKSIEELVPTPSSKLDPICFAPIPPIPESNVVETMVIPVQDQPLAEAESVINEENNSSNEESPIQDVLFEDQVVDSTKASEKPLETGLQETECHKYGSNLEGGTVLSRFNEGTGEPHILNQHAEEVEQVNLEVREVLTSPNNQNPSTTLDSVLENDQGQTFKSSSELENLTIPNPNDRPDDVGFNQEKAEPSQIHDTDHEAVEKAEKEEPLEFSAEIQFQEEVTAIPLDQEIRNDVDLVQGNEPGKESTVSALLTIIEENEKNIADDESASMKSTAEFIIGDDIQTNDIVSENLMAETDSTNDDEEKAVAPLESVIKEQLDQELPPNDLNLELANDANTLDGKEPLKKNTTSNVEDSQSNPEEFFDLKMAQTTTPSSDPLGTVTESQEGKLDEDNPSELVDQASFKKIDDIAEPDSNEIEPLEANFGYADNIGSVDDNMELASLNDLSHELENEQEAKNGVRHVSQSPLPIQAREPNVARGPSTSLWSKVRQFLLNAEVRTSIQDRSNDLQTPTRSQDELLVMDAQKIVIIQQRRMINKGVSQRDAANQYLDPQEVLNIRQQQFWRAWLQVTLVFGALGVVVAALKAGMDRWDQD